jgi:pyrroline-5-carboxylate reductase
LHPAQVREYITAGKGSPLLKLLQVKNAVASPAGTTISGILALEDSGLRAAMMSAVKAAMDRAVELKQS